ncbi:hypothetical protein [Caballeronia humi]|jgi:hypothetical protein|uniref:Uncharacterized protein n=1 Tax=Caballeronia humi TaxID=326474 RepID=A0A158GKU4_9BURK|nr:hypothetical protein [Caballeronia humi]SAL32563.1 hypothetical protein AWB65_02157 [Caballeronia humi]
MIDDQVNPDEIAESNKLPSTDESKRERHGDAAAALYGSQPVPQMRWIRHAKQWFGAGAGVTRAK